MGLIPTGFPSSARARFSVLGMLLTLGCSESTAPPARSGPNLATVGSALLALTEAYGTREANTAISLLTTDYRFVPVRPESIPFLTPPDSTWNLDRETQILSELLVEGRINWLDQVLLEIDEERRDYLNPESSQVRVTASTDLTFLIGANILGRGESRVVYTYRRNSQGDFLLAEERELDAQEISVGELKASVLEEGPIPP